MAAELLRRLTATGFILRAEGNGIRVTPASRLALANRRDIAQHKADLLELLRLEDFCRELEADEGLPAGSVFAWRPGDACPCGRCGTAGASPS